VPEIKRTELAGLVLQVKVLGLGRVAEFMASLLDPPAAAAVARTVSQLVEMGALAAEASDPRLTPLGFHLAQLPLDPRLGKALIYGAVLRCVDPLLTIVAALAERSPFRPLPPAHVMEPEERARIEAARAKFSGGGAGAIASCSDHIALVRAYHYWRLAGAETPGGGGAGVNGIAVTLAMDAVDEKIAIL
jgi:ATP-dependent RNA helicase DHX36